MSHKLTSNEVFINRLKTGKRQPEQDDLLYYVDDDIKNIKTIVVRIMFINNTDVYMLENDDISGIIIVENDAVTICKSNYERYNDFFEVIRDFFIVQL